MNLLSKDRSLGKMLGQEDSLSMWLLVRLICILSIGIILSIQTVVTACLRHILSNLLSEFCYKVLSFILLAIPQDSVKENLLGGSEGNTFLSRLLPLAETQAWSGTEFYS